MTERRRTYRDVVREIADDAGGVVTTRAAAEQGVPAVELRKLAARGFLEHVARGVYRVPEVAGTDSTEFAEAVALGGEDAFLAADSVLALLDLGQVNPRTIKVAGPHRVRRRWPDWVEYHRRAAPSEGVTEYKGVRAAPLVAALMDSRGSVMPERLADAARQAQAAGLLTSSEAARVLAALQEG